MKKFKLEIDIGNAAMMKPADIGRALGQVGFDLLTMFGWPKHNLIGGVIHDRNGNTVGKWSVE